MGKVPSGQNIKQYSCLSTLPGIKYGQRFGSTLTYGKQPTILLDGQGHKWNKVGTYVAETSQEELCECMSQNEPRW